MDHGINTKVFKPRQFKGHKVSPTKNNQEHNLEKVFNQDLADQNNHEKRETVNMREADNNGRGEDSEQIWEAVKRIWGWAIGISFPSGPLLASSMASSKCISPA